jgi:hypothetical protein
MQNPLTYFKVLSSFPLFWECKGAEDLSDCQLYCLDICEGLPKSSDPQVEKNE